MSSGGLELLTIKIQQMTIESTNDQLPTTPAITYSECYAQVFSRLFLGDCLVESDKIESGSVDLILTDLPYRKKMVEHNFEIGRRLYSMQALIEYLESIVN